MRKLQLLTSLVLLTTVPSMLVHPHDVLMRSATQAQGINDEEAETAKDYSLSYDDMLRLFDEIESGELENKCTSQDLENVKHFVAFLAKEGVLPDDSDESLSLDHDIEELLNGEANLYESPFSFADPGEYQYMIVPAVLNKHGEIVLCKSWLHKQWKHVKKFAKKHKKALIIGAAVVVAAAAVVVAVAAASTATAGAAAGAASAAGAAAGSSDSHHKADKSDSVELETPSGEEAAHEAPILKAAIDDQISSFKENIVQSGFFGPTHPSEEEELSWEENGRALGSLFAHDSYQNLQHQLPCHPRLSQEIREINSKHTFPIPGGDQGVAIGHPEIDRKFSTDYGYLYLNSDPDVDFNTLSYQIRGERALSLGYYNQAVQDLSKAIEANPDNPHPYLERGMAHFGLGQYDRSLEDYERFTSQTPNPLSVSEFSLGFAKGLPQGVYESGEGLFLFMADFVRHPIQTSGQIVSSVSTLVDLVRRDEWGVVAEALSPEIHQLVTQWDILPAEKKGELAGYAIGKHGADILVPGALAKVAGKSVTSAQELTSVCKHIQRAQETLVLETAAGMGGSAKIGEVVEAGKKTAFLAEELGLTTQEMGQLKKTGELEIAIAKNYEHLNLSVQNSIELHKKARDILKPYVKKPMPENQIRMHIHETGIPTFSRPKGIPENYIVRITDRGAGMEYVHPTNRHLSIRVMPGKLHSPHLHQQKPYVIQMKDGKAFDKFGNLVSHENPEAHIPINEFIFRE